MIPVSTQLEPGQAHIRIGIYYAKNLLQSQLVTSSVTATEQESAGSSSWIDYTLTADLGDLSFLPPRDLHVLTNQNADGTHRVIVNGGRDGILPLNLAEGQIRDMLKATRQGLRQIHYEEWGGQLGSEPQRRTLLNRDNGKTKQAFLADLEPLARLGWKLFATVRPQQRPEAWGVLRAPATIQVSRTRGSTFVFPWALVYDIPLETFAKPVPCPLIRDWDGRSAFVDSTARHCPRAQDHGNKNTLCPFGFWGYRHIIEQVPSMPDGWDLPLLIRVDGEPLELVVGRSVNLPTTATIAHLNALRRELCPRFTLQDCDSLAEIVRALAGPVELVYLYCHGRRRPLAGSDQQTPSLEVGNGEVFQPEDVLAWQQADWPPQHWLDTSPLVFINGCHTGEITPESLVNFVDNFSAAYAAGVIGTEISLEQPMASEAAQVFFHHFQAGQVTVEQALQRMRIHFLLKGNVLGLAYTPYCSAELKLGTR